MNTLIFIFILIVIYLIAAVPTGIVLARVMGYEDVRDKGSGNIGATNVYRVAGKLAGVRARLDRLGRGRLGGFAPGLDRVGPQLVAQFKARKDAVFVAEQYLGGVTGRGRQLARIGDAVFEQHFALHAELAGRRCGLPDVIGLHGADRDDRVGAPLQRLAHRELELACLVPTRCEAGAVIPLDPDFRPAEFCRQARHVFQRRRQMGKMQAGKAGEVHVRLAPVSRDWIGV